MLWKAPKAPPPGAPLALYASPFPEIVLVTSEGAFTTRDGAAFTRVAGSPGSVVSSALLVDGDGDPVLELRAKANVHRWSRGAWTSPKAPGLLKGGIFRDDSVAPARTFRSLYEADGTLVWREAGRRMTLSSPAPGLAFSAAVTAPGGRLYVGTTGDGLYLFEPTGPEAKGGDEAVGEGLSPAAEREPGS
jgi:hypothetical protein